MALLLSISNLSFHILFWDNERMSEGKPSQLPSLDLLKASAFVCLFKIWSATFIKSLLCVRAAVVIKKEVLAEALRPVEEMGRKCGLLL